MKITILYLTLFGLISSFSGQLPTEKKPNPESTDLSVLIGHWKIDLSPEDDNHNNFAKMIISSVDENSVEGIFYRDGVKIKEARVAISQGIIYVSLISGDNSGTYNTSFHFNDGKSFGTTHSLDKDFLAVWKAIKLTE